MHIKRPDQIITNRRKEEEVRNSLLQTTAYYTKAGLQVKNKTLQY